MLKLVSLQCWLHVPTELNPADCASRGLMPSELSSFDLWSDGPSYLTVEPIDFPTQPQLNSNTAPEQCPSNVCNLVRQATPLFLQGRYSKYYLTLKVTAWCRRFINNLKANSNQSSPLLTSSLNPNELQAAEHLLFAQSQALSFEHEVDQLTLSRARAKSYL